MELLAPAGNPASLYAAVQSGADAVYIGVNSFGARQSAANFSFEELAECIDYCHLYGVDVHVTMNTLIKNNELSSFISCLKKINTAKADAIIVQDLGAADIIKNTLPDMTLHASTQMTVTSLEGVSYLKKLGFSRVVLARELSKEEISHICKNTDVETEVFVHGAICMCYSGQCLMSSILGGRSGNRGRCAQPCRLPYELLENGERAEQGYLLSPKDMSLVNELKTLRELGVKSLKIEGRLKRAEYVSAVVGIYRKYLDSCEKVSQNDMKELTDAFSRSGFTDGYFKNNLGKNMMSHRTPGNSADNKFSHDALKRAEKNANIRKIPVSISASLKKDEPLELTIYDNDGNSAYARGEQKAEAAMNKPLDEKRLLSQLTKLGSTPFECVSSDVYADSGIVLPVSEINMIRRNAAEALKQTRSYRCTGAFFENEYLKKHKRKSTDIILTAEVRTLEQLLAAAENGIRRIYAPSDVLKQCDTSKFSEIEFVTKTSDILSEEKINTASALVPSPAAIYKYSDKKLYGDFRLNVFNSVTAEFFSELHGITLSPELNIHEIENILEYTDVPTELIAYGHLPLMIMKNCPVKATGRCQKGKNIYTLKDRKNQEMPIICLKNCRAAILNSKPVFMADKLKDLLNLKINSLRLIFTVENFSQCDKIIDVYKRAMNGEKIDALPENSFTRGHFYRGVL